jgi:hypothetical protein
MRGALLGVIVLAAACSEARAPTKVPGRTATPSCPRGAFATELDALLPPLAPVRPIELFPVATLDRKIEPGCVVPFRREPDDRLLDVGRVVVKASSRTAKGKPVLLGRGRLEVGRRQLRLRLLNAGGDESLTLIIDGAHVSFREKGKKPFEADIASTDTSPLPLPFDALVAGLDKCDDDQRLGRTEDGNVIEARRGELGLWRSRWMDTHANAIVDTSFVCSGEDARLVWRTAVGDCLPMLAVASARSDRLLVIVRQGPSETEDIMDYGFDGAR